MGSGPHAVNFRRRVCSRRVVHMPSPAAPVYVRMANDAKMEGWEAIFSMIIMVDETRARTYTYIVMLRSKPRWNLFSLSESLNR
ncbi:hypothetical protein QQP08_000560, partial [Theobroma cacao]